MLSTAYEVLLDIPDELRVLLAVRKHLFRRGRNERKPPLAVIDPQFRVEVEVQPVVEQHDLKVVRRL